MTVSDVLEGWERSAFTAGDIGRDTFRRGSGPAVIVIHEVPGITPKVAAFANEVVARGFTVVMPSLVGEPGREVSNGYAARSFLKVCVAKEFATWATNRTSPIVSWLRALAGALHRELGGPGVGAVGMCYSGGFALGMMVDDVVVAPVLSQPSLPLPIGKRRQANLGLSLDDEAEVVRRASEGCQVLGLRYIGDPFVADRFDTLRRLLGDAFIAVELPRSSKLDHSVLTEQRDQVSVDRVLDFFAERLLV